MSEGSAGVVPVGNVEALKRLKEVETSWETKLSQTRSEVAARVALARDAAEKAIQAARTEMDRARETRLAEARSQAQTEAERILADGKRSAEALAQSTSKSVDALKGKLLDAVLGDFRGTDSGGK